MSPRDPVFRPAKEPPLPQIQPGSPTNFQNVLDTQRSLFNQQDQLAASEGILVQNLVALYKALGGGWDPEALPPVPESRLSEVTEEGQSQ